MNIKNPTSFFTAIIILCFIFFLVIINTSISPLSWDVMGYHVYWVQLLVHHDIHIYNLDFYHNIEDTYNNTNTLYQFVSTEAGNSITKYPYGWALLNAPFILFGHLYALVFDYPIDGFSKPYQIAALLSSLFYTSLGIFWFRKVLLHFFTDKWTVFILVAVLLGTNYLNINYLNPGMTHVYLFSLYAALLLQTIRFHQTYKFKNALLIGLIIGLMVATRPTEIVAAFIPLLWGINSFSDLLERIKFVFTKHLKLYLPAVIMASLFIFPQLLYWKVTTGSWVFYSYNNAGEGLDLRSPHTYNFLLSFRKGWWIYTPIMLFATLGFYHVYKRNKSIFWALFVYFILNLYLISSWTTWWYADSFSQRAIEQSYPIMGITLGYFLIAQVKWRKVVLLLFSILIAFNLFQSYQFHHQVLPLDRITKEYYFSVFGQLKSPTEAQLKLLSIERNQTIFTNEEEYNKIQTFKYQGKKPLMMSQEENVFTQNIKVPYKELTSKDHVWIRGYGIITPQSDPENSDFHFTMTMTHKGNPYTWRGKRMSSENSSMLQKDTLIFEYLTPEIRLSSDTLSVGFWHQNGDSVLLHDFYIEVWEPKK